MCDISKVTTYKTKTVYKAAFKFNGTYRSAFTGFLLEKGKVSTDMDKIKADIMPIVGRLSEQMDEDSVFYNTNMIGRVSGFALKEDALTVSRDLDSGEYIKCVLKIKLGGLIMKGTAARISFSVPGKHATYAGTEILSIEEIE